MAKKDKRKDDIIRSGDTVSLKVPEFFVRCGYPKDFHEEVENIKSSDERQKFINFLNEIGCRGGDKSKELDIFDHHRSFDAALEKIIKAVAYCRVKQDHFGGNQREIYTKDRSDEFSRGDLFRVIEIKFCKTGTYNRGYGGGGYNVFGDYDDYTPPYLTGEKTHKILGVAKKQKEGDFYCSNPEYWIEAKNVSKVKNDD